MVSIHTEVNKSPMFCRKCNTHVSRYAQDMFLEDLSIYCTKCQKARNEFGLGVKVLPSSAKYTKTSIVRSDHWYHSTRVREWDKRYVEFSDPIYLGTRNAAVRRFKDLSTSATNHKKSGWLYKIRLKPGVKVHGNVLIDDHLDPSTAEYEDRVVRYVNMFESIGSISLVTRPEHIEIVDVKELAYEQ